MIFHVVSLPHTSTTRDYSWCAYTEKVRKWCDMMSELGHTIYLYAGEENEAACTEHVDCTGYEFAERIPEFDPNLPGWQAFAAKAIPAIGERKQPGDFLCLIGGRAQQPIALAHPDLLCVEFGVGYEGIFSDYKVFESYAWMHTVYGWAYGAAKADGKFYDTVIPNYFEADAFPAGNGSGDYLLYLGRLTERKGLCIVDDIVKRTGLPLVVAGEGDTSLIPEGADYVGGVGPTERAKLMGEARAILVPTLYLEPFGGVAVEAQLCGTPAITTDWGAFPETVAHGWTGFRCHTLAEFCRAADDVLNLDRDFIRRRALGYYSTEAIAPLYQDYFDRLSTLWGGGWYA